ncbi:MAG TPA: hypothetical protein PKZ36_00440 [Candidatus Paceibacterota bacterium]|nr:hypothetical protein [Candidatus Paceibacterota bacterium]HPT17867.1 hypothetical protein [Candidatus Paceibacterota bacterium]
MKKIFQKIIIIFLFIICCFLGHKVEAARIELDSSKTELNMHEQFYVDLVLYPENVSFNGIEGSINFPTDKLSFIRSEVGKSVINLWIKEPEEKKGKIKFSGLITNGFSGVIDPFDSENKLPGTIIRFVFEPLMPGNITLETSSMLLAKNDGMGTLENIEPQSINLVIQDINNLFFYLHENDTNPELEASVVREPNLYDNKYVLIFNAKDKESGIKSVMIKEGNRNWVEIKSPYLLKDQTRHSLISVRAVNFSGVSTVIAIEPINYENAPGVKIAIAFVLVVFIYFIAKKVLDYFKKKKEH